MTNVAEALILAAISIGTLRGHFVDCRKKIEEIGEKTSPAMSQEEIVSSTKTVVQGLETLRVEHHQVLNGLQTSTETANTSTSAATDLIEEKILLLKKSIETIELAMGEAQVLP